jgi:hypothetical protein
MKAWFRTRWFIIPAALALLVGLYALAGFWLAPKLVRSQASAFVSEKLGKSLTLGEIRTNPFTFELDIRDIKIRDIGIRDVATTGAPSASGSQAGGALVALDHLFVDFQVASLWERAYTFRQVILDGPYARAIIRPDGSLNLAELLPPSDEPEAPLPGIWIQDFRVDRGRVDFADQSRSLRPEKRLSPITFTLRDFRTTSEGGGFQLAAASDEGERFDWSGRLSLQPLKSDGHFQVAGLTARGIHEFLSDMLPFRLAGGGIDLAGDYTFAVVPGDTMRFEATLPTITARELALRAHGVDHDWVLLPKATLEHTRLSLHDRRIAIDALNLEGLKATLWREADGTLNLQRLLTATASSEGIDNGAANQAQPPPASTATASTSTAAPSAEPGSDWTFSLARLDLRQGDVSLEDRTVQPVANFHLAPLAVTADRLTLDLSQAVPVTVQATVNDVAPVEISGDVVPDAFAATLQISVSKLPIAQVRAYLPDYATLSLKAGTAAATGTLTLQPDETPGPGLRFAGDATVSDFELVEAASQRPFLSWQQLDVAGLDYTAGPDALSIRTVTATRPFARVAIAPDRTLNLVTMFGDPAPAPETAANRSSAPMPIRIDRVVLASGTMSFADFSIDPNFQARIEALRGSITGLSTAADSRAKIDLDGHIINRHSPVSITGETNIAAYDRHSDITMAFRNIELPIFNPYSGRWAGYAIAKGKLSTELHYRIDDRKLDADHHIVIDQLEWGGATDSKDKVSLPIRLATSLLKDRHGVIDLDLPVAGTLDDPSFRIGPVIWQIIRNLIVKIVTAPFSFLGSLFEGAEDARYVDFAPGSAELPATANAALSALAKGLGDRPALKLDIPAGPAGEEDARTLAEQRFMATLAAINGNTAEGTAFDYAALEPDDRLDLLEDLYRQEMDEKPRPPEAPEPGDELSRKERKAARQLARIAWLEEQLRPRFTASDSELVQLGQTRATAVQEALLADGGLDPARVFLAAGQQAVAADGMMRVELGLK